VLRLLPERSYPLDLYILRLEHAQRESVPLNANVAARCFTGILLERMQVSGHGWSIVAGKSGIANAGANTVIEATGNSMSVSRVLRRLMLSLNASVD
jgi:hypothetical protein